MKMILIIGLLSILVFGIYSFKNSEVDFEANSTEGIQFFKGTFQEALEKAKTENKPIFLDLYATWCGPCKKLKKTTFKDDEVGAYFNSHFINLAIDGETPEGKKLMQKYDARSYPSLFILDSNGIVKTSATGFHKPHQLVNFGRRIVPQQ